MFVVGLSPKCFPAFHLANIAAAISSQGRAVRVTEQSGLLANTAFFLSLPPEVYVGGVSRAVPTTVSALGGIRIRFLGRPANVAGGAAEVPVDSGGVVDLFHMPPTDDPTTLRRDVEEILGSAEESIVVLIGRAADVDRTAWFGGESWMRVCVVDTGRRVDRDAAGVDVIGSVSRWEGALVDLILPVLRDSGSSLARAYGLIARRLLPRLANAKEIDERSTTGAGRTAGFGAR